MINFGCTETRSNEAHLAALQWPPHSQLDGGPYGDVWQQQAGRKQPGALWGHNDCSINLHGTHVVAGRCNLHGNNARVQANTVAVSHSQQGISCCEPQSAGPADCCAVAQHMAVACQMRVSLHAATSHHCSLAGLCPCHLAQGAMHASYCILECSAQREFAHHIELMRLQVSVHKLFLQCVLPSLSCLTLPDTA